MVINLKIIATKEWPHSNAYNIALFFSSLVIQLFWYTTVLSNITLLITQSRLSIAQASSSFKPFNKCMILIHDKSMLVTEGLHHASYVYTTILKQSLKQLKKKY